MRGEGRKGRRQPDGEVAVPGDFRAAGAPKVRSRRGASGGLAPARRSGALQCGMTYDSPDQGAASSPRPKGRLILVALDRFELILYTAVGIFLGAAAVLVLAGTVNELVSGIAHGKGAVNTAVTVMDRVLLTLIIAELVYTLGVVLRTHEIVVEPFLFIGLIAVVRRILIVTAQFERPPPTANAVNTLILELGLLGFLTLTLSVAVYLIRRSRSDLARTPNAT